MSAWKPRLTEAEAQAGVRPPTLTRQEWHAMWGSSLLATADALQRTDEQQRAARRST